MPRKKCMSLDCSRVSVVELRSQRNESREVTGTEKRPISAKDS